MFDLANLSGKVAVITGSASGLGLNLAIECQRLNMHIVLTDVRQKVLNDAVKMLRDKRDGSRVVGFTCDVTRGDDVQKLLISVKNAFPDDPIGFVGANAGVLFTGSTLLTGSEKEWQKTFDVNIHGIYLTLKTFVPVLMSQRTPSIVEITASAAGVVFGGNGPYNLSKLSALGIAEALQQELEVANANDRVKVVVLCPSIVQTDLLKSGQAASNGSVKAELMRSSDATSANTVKMFSNAWTRSMKPDWVAEQVMKHVQDEKFYCILSNVEGFNSTYSDNIDARIIQRYAAMKSRQLAPFVNHFQQLPQLALMPLDLSKLKGGIAVITGSASGIGYAMGKKAKSLGMHVVLSDVREKKLLQAIHKLRMEDGEGRVEGFAADVRSLSSLKALLKSTLDAFPGRPIQFLGANAGVISTGSTVLTGSPEEWKLTYDVNVLGAAKTLQTFVTHMASSTSRDKPCVVEITASSAGIMFGSFGPYGTSKHAVVGLGEELYKELLLYPGNPLSSMRIVVLCPAIVNTELLKSGEEATSGAIKSELGRVQDSYSTNAEKGFQGAWENGMTPDYVAQEAFRHVQNGKFYCILDNTLEANGMTLDLEGQLDRRFNAMISRDIRHKNTMIGKL